MRALLRDPLSGDAFRQAGTIAFSSALGLGSIIILFGAWKSLTLLVAFTLLLVAIPIGLFLFSRPVLNLSILIASFVLIAGYEEGTQITEVVWGLYYLAFLGHWFCTRIFLYRDRIFERREARVLTLFLVLMTTSGVLTVMFGGSMRFYIGEWLSLSFLSLYFPVREVIARHRYGLHAILGAIAFIGLFVLARNVLNYREIIVSATYAWQVTRGRAVTNEALMMIPSLFALVMLVHAKTLKEMALYAAPFGLYFGGLILTQSRGYWVAFAAAGLLLLVVIDALARKRLIGIGVLSVAALIGIGYAVLGDYFMLIVSGLLDRVLSIGSAATTDISLVNRIRESQVVFEKILDNPILGYGMGVPFRFYDLTFLPAFTHATTFVHNGYLALWYKFGIWGLGMVLYLWWSAARLGLTCFRKTRARLLLRYAGLAAAASLSAFTLSAMTSNPFYVNDTMFMFGILFGMTAGIESRIGAEAHSAGLRPMQPAGLGRTDSSGA